MITVLGPTASGKTGFAANLAYRIDGEIISADSRQVYRNMDIGTGKDYKDYIINGVTVPYHLIDIVDAGEKYNVYEYQKDFIKVLNDITGRNKLPVLCGGSGLYIESVLKGYKLIHVPPNRDLRKKLENKTLGELTDILRSFKKLHNKTDIDNKKRAIRAIEIETYYSENPDIDVDYPVIKNFLAGIRYDRESRRERITQRLKERLETGLVDEVRGLLDSGIPENDLEYYGLEYKYVTRHITGKIDYNEMFDKLNVAIHQFAKRQMTWFRRMERNGMKIHWIDGSLSNNEKTKYIMDMTGYPKK